MTDAGQASPPDTDPAADRTAPWLDPDVDGRPVRFRIGNASAIATVTLGFGAFWVWGRDRGMQMAGETPGGLGPGRGGGAHRDDGRVLGPGRARPSCPQAARGEV